MSSSNYAQQRFTTPDGLSLVGDVGGDPDAPAVILLHGGGQTRHSWAQIMHQLVERGYFVVNYDARGHGDSDWSPTGDYSIQALASDLCAIRKTIHGPAVFVGASMGGMTSFYAVGNSEPPVAEALVMVDIVLRVVEEGVEKIRGFMTSHRNGFANIEEAVEAVVAYNPDRPRPKDPSGLRKNLREGDDGRLYWHWDPRMLDVSPSSEPPSQLDALVEISKDVSVPLLVVRGEHSDIVDDEGIAEMCALVPQTEVYEVAGAGHMVAGDKNDAFSTGVLSFLDRHFPVRSAE
ncbi:MAG: alpha/beta hydrolase [Emcibacter sp.]|nr:alpha/beta hydrolase [Emcibacter sp.]